MIGIAPPDFVMGLAALPEGSITGDYGALRYIATKTLFNDGRSVKLVAEQLGGRDRISLNLYHLTAGARLYPCQMSRARAIAFVAGFRPDAA